MNFDFESFIDKHGDSVNTMLIYAVIFAALLYNFFLGG